MTHQMTIKYKRETQFCPVPKYPIPSFCLKLSNHPKRYRLHPSLLRIDELIELGWATSPRLLVDL